MNKEELIENITKCNSLNNNCDFLLEHNDCDLMTEIFEENKRLNRQVIIMERYFELIMDIAYDYDGYNDVDNLKALIDGLRKVASHGRVADDKQPVFYNSSKVYNILNEELDVSR